MRTWLGEIALVGLALVGLVAPCPAQEQVELPPAMDRVLRDYEGAWQAKDPAALAALFAEDGFVLGHPAPPRERRAATRTSPQAGTRSPLVLTAWGCGSTHAVLHSEIRGESPPRPRRSSLPPRGRGK